MGRRAFGQSKAELNGSPKFSENLVTRYGTFHGVLLEMYWLCQVEIITSLSGENYQTVVGNASQIRTTLRNKLGADIFFARNHVTLHTLGKFCGNNNKKKEL